MKCHPASDVSPWGEGEGPASLLIVAFLLHSRAAFAHIFLNMSGDGEDENELDETVNAIKFDNMIQWFAVWKEYDNIDPDDDLPNAQAKAKERRCFTR